MKSFIQRWGGKILGVLNGWDRLRLRGTKRWLANAKGLLGFLWQKGVLLKDFGRYAESVSDQIRVSTEEAVRQTGRPYEYLASSTVSKEDIVRGIMQRDGIRQGLLAVLRCVEPCWSFEVHRNRDTKEIELRSAWRKCLHYYHYFLDPDWGFMHVRLQTWLPFTMHVCLNGRERLARQLQAAGIGYVQRDNCFTAIDDVPRAQALCTEQLATNWPALLDGWANRVNPAHAAILGDCVVPYYWSVDQSEWASDVMFRSAADLAGLYPRWIRHGMERLGSREVMRFLGRKLPAQGYGKFTGEVVSQLRERPEGLCIKHRVNENSVKMYDKQGSVLRVETTLNNPRDMKVFRPKEGDEGGEKQWRYLRKGVADLYRRAEVSQKANERYLEAQAAVADTTPLHTWAEELCRPVRWKKQRVRALNPLAAEDAALLEAVHRGEFALNGFRNRDLRALLFSQPAADLRDARRQSGMITRKIRLLRAHGLIRKVPKTHRYVLTPKGQKSITALLAARQADTTKLIEVA